VRQFTHDQNITDRDGGGTRGGCGGGCGESRVDRTRRGRRGSGAYGPIVGALPPSKALYGPQTLRWRLRGIEIRLQGAASVERSIRRLLGLCLRALLAFLHRSLYLISKHCQKGWTMPTREEIEAELHWTLAQETSRLWQEVADDWREHWQKIVEAVEAEERDHGFMVLDDMSMLDRMARAGFSKETCDRSRELIDAVVILTETGRLPRHLQGKAVECDDAYRSANLQLAAIVAQRRPTK
jgi:hypothetical protein